MCKKVVCVKGSVVPPQVHCIGYIDCGLSIEFTIHNIFLLTKKFSVISVALNRDSMFLWVID